MEEAQPKVQPEEQAKKFNSKKILILLVLLLVVAGGVIAVVMLSSEDEPEENSSPLDTSGLEVEGANLIDNGDGTFVYEYYDQEVIERNSRMIEADATISELLAEGASVVLAGEEQEKQVSFLESIEYITLPDYRRGSYSDLEVDQKIRLFYDPVDSVVARLSYLDPEQEELSEFPPLQSDIDDGLDE